MKWNELEMDFVYVVYVRAFFMFLMRSNTFFQFMKWKMSTILNCCCCCFFLRSNVRCCTNFFSLDFVSVEHPFFHLFCVSMTWAKKINFYTRKQCFYSNCYSVAHSWHYFPTLIKFHPNHNSNHVGALLQSLSNMRIITIEPVVIIVFGYTIYIRVPTHTTQTRYIHAYILTFLTFLWHSPKANSIHPLLYIYMLNGKREQEAQTRKKAKKSLGWSTTVVCFILGCV